MKMLHTMLRVGDLQKSIDFYTGAMGMELLRTTERPEQKYSLAFVGFNGGNKNGEAEIELTYNLDNVSATCERIREAGGKITREAGPVKGGNTIIAFAEDPDQYKIELIETGSRDIS